MANTLGYYNPAFYANEALIWLSKALGLASRVHLGYDAERRTFGLGDTINIKKPSTFAAQDAPGSATDVTTGSVQISLSNWREVRFTLSDKELSYTGDRIVSDHIMPAAYALADDIDQKVATLFKKVPHVYVQGQGTPSASATIAGILAARQKMFDLGAPLRDAANCHFMIGGQEEATLLALSDWAQYQGAGDFGVETQRVGSIGRKYGFEFFANQNRPTITYANHADGSGTISADAAKGATSIAVASMGVSKEYKAGTVVKFTSSGQEYVLLNDETTAAGETGTWEIYPALRAAESSGAAITTGTGQVDDVNNINLAFHRNAFALAMARLPDHQGLSNGLGIQVASVQDPVTGLSIRSRIAYDNANSAIQVVLDCLYGYQILDGDLACRYEVATA